MKNISCKVIITTYKVATVLEVDIDTGVRNKRKEKALEAISNLINNDQEDDVKRISKVEEKEIKEEKTKEKHHKESSEKHGNKKKKKSKHK